MFFVVKMSIFEKFDTNLHSYYLVMDITMSIIQIQDYALGEYEVKFMEKKGGAYVWPDKDDVSIIPCYDVACVLPAPHLVGRGRYVFN